MKKIVLPITVLFACAALQAQSVADGNKQLYYERYGSAAQTFNQIVQQQPDNAAAWYGLTHAYLLQNEAGKAAHALRQVPQSIIEEPFYQVAYGAVLLHENKKDNAALAFNNALDETRRKAADILAAIARAHIEAKNGDAQYAVELLQKAIKREKRDARLQVLLGDAYRKLGNGSEAYKAYQRAIKEDAGLAAAYHKTGEIFLSQKNPGLYLEYFTKAVTADPRYAPSFYKLYSHAFYHDPAKAKQYYKSYLANADTTIENEYDLADLLYLNNEYNKAIQKATSLLASQGEKAPPRLYKLIGYSYAELNDTAQAIAFMNKYLSKEADSNIIAKDYAALASLYTATDANDSLVAHYYTKAISLEKDSTVLYGHFKKLADLAKSEKDYAARAHWLGNYYTGNEAANNLDLFNWGLAHYRAGEYEKSDSVFGIYVAQYPEQGFGYYWQAKSRALQDTAMTKGLAVPAYLKLIEVLQKDTTDANYEKWIVEAYGYLAAYKANVEKDYAAAIDYFEKILAVNPENESAEKYIAILKNDRATKNDN